MLAKEAKRRFNSPPMTERFIDSPRNRDILVVGGLALLFLQVFLLRAPLHDSLWLDETLSVWVAAGSVHETIARAVEYQGQSPFYFLIVHELLRVSTDEFFLRLPSFLALIGAGVVFYRLLRRWFMPEVALLGVALLFAIDHVIVAGLSVRPYALALLSSLGASLMLVRWAEYGGSAVRLSVWTLLMAATFYLHYLFGAIALVHFVFVLCRWRGLSRNQRLGFAIACAVGIAAAIPGLGQILSLAGRAPSLSFAPTPSWRHFAHSVLPLGSVIFICMGLALARVFERYSYRPGWWRGTARNAAPFLVWWLGAPIAFFIHAHFTGHSMYLDRWFLWVAPAACIPFLLLVSGIVESRPRFIAISAAFCFMIFREADHVWHTEDWRGAAAAVREMPADTAVLLYSGLIELEDSAWLADPTRYDYLAGPFSVYSAGRKAVLVSGNPEGVRGESYRRTVLEPALRGMNSVALVALKKTMTTRTGKFSIPDRWEEWLHAQGFTEHTRLAAESRNEVSVERFSRPKPTAAGPSAETLR